jgi:hypothetical protein
VSLPTRGHHDYFRTFRPDGRHRDRHSECRLDSPVGGTFPAPQAGDQLAASSVTAPPLALPAQYSAQLAEWWQELFLPSADRPFPSPPTEPLPTPGSIPSSLEAAYHAIEPWVQYGFEIAQYAVGWIPYVGWLSGQIMIFYQLGEGIVHAIAHNTLDWLDGNGSFAQNLGEGIRWSIDTLIQFGINEWNYFLPPLPPFPPSHASSSAPTWLSSTLR